MKFIYTIPVLLILSCGQADNADTTRDSTNITNKVNEDPLAQYDKFVSGLDSFNVETASAAAKKYQEVFKDEDVAIRDKGFVIFDAYYEKLDRNSNMLHEQDTTNFEPLFMLDPSGKSLPVPQKLKDYNDRLKRNGFEVSSTEGMSYIAQERDFIAQWFYDYVSPAMKDYLVQLNKENKEGFSNDAALVITPGQYADRLAWWDQFIKNNANFPLISKAKENRKLLLTFFLTGMDNSPLLEYETNKLSAYFKEAYTYLQKTYPGSETSKIVDPYFKALLQNDLEKANAVLNDYRKDGLIIDFQNM